MHSIFTCILKYLSIYIVCSLSAVSSCFNLISQCISLSGNAIYARLKLLKRFVQIYAYDRIYTGIQGMYTYSSLQRYSPVFMTSSHHLFFEIDAPPVCFSNTPFFRVYFRAVKKGLRDSLHVVHTSSLSGYIQPVGLVPEALYGIALINNATYRLVPPAGHVVMTSLQWMYLITDFACWQHLYLFAQFKGGGKQLIWKKCRGHDVTPEVYNTTLVIRFQGRSRESSRGFKLVYTFHPWIRSPKKQPNGRFNCSVSYYRDFKEHVHCNHQQECEGREDEGGHCSFSSQACNGSVTTTNKCLHLYGKSLW